MDKTLIPILINKSYGVFSFSDEALNEYYKRMFNNNNNYKLETNIHEKLRYNPVLIEIVKKLGDKASGPNSKLIIEYIYKEFENYVKINNVNGKESLEILYCDYQLNNISKILNDKISSELKINKIRKILSMNFNYTIGDNSSDSE
jgi:hypothetical protein